MKKLYLDFPITEAEYAYKLRKKVIPLLVEEGYNPDGWLGALQGMKLYYKFISDDLTKTDMEQLLIALSEATQNVSRTQTSEGTEGVWG